MNMLDYTLEGVTTNGGILPSSVRLLQNVANQLRELAGNRDASLAYADMLQRNAEHMSKSVMANTPMVMATPEVHPEPGNPVGANPDRLDVSSMSGTPEEISDWSRQHAEVEEIRRKDNGDGTATAYFLPKENGDDDSKDAGYDNSPDPRDKSVRGAL